MNADRPSKKQRELLSFIDGFIKGNGYGPSYREIMRALNYKSVSTVAVHVEGLIGKGHLIKHGRSARSLEVVSSEELPKQPNTNAKAHEQWLIEQVEHRLASYKAEPSDERLAEVNLLAESLAVLGLSSAADAIKEQLKEVQK